MFEFPFSLICFVKSMAFLLYICIYVLHNVILMFEKVDCQLDFRTTLYLVEKHAFLYSSHRNENGQLNNAFQTKNNL